MSSLAEYLKKYTSVNILRQAKKMKGKKKKEKREVSVGIKIIDEDAKWQKELKELSDEEEEAGPVVEADIEVKRHLRLESLRDSRPYLQLGEDGSGWVSVSEGKGMLDGAGNEASADEGKLVNPPPRKLQNDFSDLSPPRKQARHDSPGLSPPRKGRHDSPDLSPPRKGRHDSPDLSPPRKGRHDSPDLSPPRKGQRGSPDLSPPRKGRKESPVLSPQRKGRQDTPDLSPKRRGRRDSPDLSPPRRRGSSPGPSPPIRTLKDSSEGRPRGSGTAKEDLSPPRRTPSRPVVGSDPEKRGASDTSEKNPPRMSDGTVAGLRTGKEVSEEMERKRKDDVQRFAALSAEVSGRGAQTVYRDKQGKKTNLEAIMEQGRLEAEAKKRKDLPPPIWGKGMAQTRQAMEEAKAMQEVASQPFARYEADATRDKQLKEAIRWGDPMAHLVKQPEAQLVDYSINPLFQASGFKVPQDVPQHSWLKRRVSAPVNRYGIKPGRHWDGVDRGTGFEKDYFKAVNERGEKDKQAYLWSVEDM